MTPIESIFRALLTAGPNGLRLVATQTEDGSAFIVAYCPAESASEAGEKPIGFLELRENGGALAVPAPEPEGTTPETAEKAFRERETTLRGLGAFEASELGPYGRGFTRDGKLIRRPKG